VQAFLSDGSQRSGLGEPERLGQHVGYLLKQAQHALRLAMDDALRQLGTTTAQYAALAVLQEAPGLSGAELARRCFVTPQTMNSILVSLENAGLIERRPHPIHGRILEASLTAAGRKLLARAHRAVVDIELRMLRGLDPNEQRMLAKYLQHCVGALGEGV
jgi:DNA-binding MarR family transcriptional regulator